MDIVGVVMNIFTPNRFLKIVGLILLLIGISGVVGLLGPTSSQSIFGGSFVVDSNQFSAYLIIGFIALASAFFFSPLWQRYFSVFLGITALYIGLYSFISPIFFGVHIEVPTEMIIYLVIGAWGLYAVYGNAIGKVR